MGPQVVLYDEAQNFLGLWEKGCWKSDDSGSGKKRNADGTRTMASVKQMGFALQKFMQARLGPGACPPACPPAWQAARSSPSEGSAERRSASACREAGQFHSWVRASSCRSFFSPFRLPGSPTRFHVRSLPAAGGALHLRAGVSGPSRRQRAERRESCGKEW